MTTLGENWFVGQFDLRSPIEEFEDYSRTALDRLRDGGGNSVDSNCREAIDLVLSKLNPNRTGAPRHAPTGDGP